MCCIFHLFRALALSKMISFYYLVSLFLVEDFEVSFPTGTETEYTITVPPLRDCQEDILPVAEFFLSLSNKDLECN